MADCDEYFSDKHESDFNILSFSLQKSKQQAFSICNIILYSAVYSCLYSAVKDEQQETSRLRQQVEFVFGRTKRFLTLVVRKYVSKLTSSLKSISKVFLGFLLRVSLSGKWSTAGDEVHESRQEDETENCDCVQSTIRESSWLLEHVWEPNFT